MSNKTQLQTNNASLEECIARINAAKDVVAGLPEAGGGLSYNTSNVTIVNASGKFLVNVSWSSLSNGTIIPNAEFSITPSNFVLQNVIQNTAIALIINDSIGTVSMSASDNISILEEHTPTASGTSTLRCILAKCTGEGIITINNISTCCFIAGTQVLTSLSGQTKNIEDIEVGESVVSYDIDNNENYIAEVTQVIVHENTVDIAKVTFDNGTSLIMNAYHPLYCDSGFKSITRYRGYDELVVGDVVKTVDGWSTIKNIDRYISEPIVTYNIDVRDLNENPDVDTKDTYYANGVVVKNGFC